MPRFDINKFNEDDWFSYFTYFVGLDPQTVWNEPFRDVLYISMNKVAVDEWKYSD